MSTVLHSWTTSASPQERSRRDICSSKIIAWEKPTAILAWRSRAHVDKNSEREVACRGLSGSDNEREENHPADSDDPRPRMAPQAPRLEMRLDGGQRVKNRVPGVSKLDAGRHVVKGMIQDMSKVNFSPKMQNMLRGAPGLIRNAAYAIADGVNRGGSLRKLPVLSSARGGGGLPYVLVT